jgi:hypothetical protein
MLGQNRTPPRESEESPVALTENNRGEWVPATPLPLYTSSWLRNRFGCQCGRKFRTEEDYRGHFALVHLLGLS